MKLPTIVIVAVALLAGCQRPQEQAISAPANRNAAPPRAAAPASALHWENPTVEADSKIGQKIFRTAYRFTNIGSSPVSVVEIKPSCGCVATELDKSDYAPGESGEIKVTFDLEMDDSAGLQSRTILVIASDAPKSPTELQLLVHIPETVEATPKYLTWERGEKPIAKEALVKAGSNISAMKLSLPSISSDFSVEIAPDVPAQSYRVKVTPNNTAAPSYAHIQLRADSASFGRPLNCDLNVNVK